MSNSTLIALACSSEGLSGTWRDTWSLPGTRGHEEWECLQFIYSYHERNKCAWTPGRQGVGISEDRGCWLRSDGEHFINEGHHLLDTSFGSFKIWQNTSRLLGKGGGGLEKAHSYSSWSRGKGWWSRTLNAHAVQVKPVLAWVTLVYYSSWSWGKGGSACSEV